MWLQTDSRAISYMTWAPAQNILHPGMTPRPSASTDDFQNSFLTSFFLARHDTHDKNKPAWRTEIYIYIHLQAAKIDICRITGPATWLQALVWLLQFYWLVDTILSIQSYLDPGHAVRVIWLMCMSSLSSGFLRAGVTGAV